MHELQVLDEELPEPGHDFRVDFIATPQQIIWSSEPPRGFRRLSPAQIAAIPALKARADRSYSNFSPEFKAVDQAMRYPATSCISSV